MPRRPDRRLAVVLLAAALAGLLAGCSAAAPAHPAANRRASGTRTVSGRVVAETPTAWTVQPAHGAPMTVTLTPATAFGRPHQKATAAQFPVGSSVRVTTATQGGTVVARRVAPPLSGRTSPGPTTPAPTPSSPVPAPTTTPTPPPPSAPPDAAAAVAAAGTAAARHPDVSVGVAVAPAGGGPVTLGPGGSTPFESASVVKLYTAVDVLHRGETGADQVSPQDRDDIQQALSASDDDAMDELWEAHGGSDTVTDTVALAGLTDTAPPDDPGEWGLTTTSARDILAVWHYALTALSPADRDLVVGATSSSTPAGADGFDQSFGLLADPRPAGVAAKQGWMSDGDLYLHTTGLPSAGAPWLVAVLTLQPSSESWDDARATVNDVTAALTDAGRL